MAIGATTPSREKVEGSLASPEFEMACLQLLDCLEDSRLFEPVLLTFQEADGVYAAHLDALVSQLKTDSTAPVKMLRAIESGYLKSRNMLIKKLGSVRQGADLTFRRVEVVFPKYPKNAKKGIVSDLDPLIEAAKTLGEQQASILKSA
jgi:hypothetical protein